MNIVYTAKNVNLRDNFKERVEKKLKKFERIFNDDATVTVLVSLYKNRQTVEITINSNGIVYRAEKTEIEMNDALDKVVEALSRQIRKHKAKLEKKVHSGSLNDFIAESALQSGQDDEDQDYSDIEYSLVRRKQIPVRPLSIEEAILQMNMVDHKFYMFINGETGEINVVYCRNNGDYGLLEPKFN